MSRIRLTSLQIKTIIVVILLIALGVFLAVGPLKEPLMEFFRFVYDKERLSAYIKSFGLWAPVIFTLSQILQVIIAPIPGEATGFLGGYLFGTWKGIIFSTVGLTIGSMISFWLAQILGRNFVRKLLSESLYNKLNSLTTQKGKLVVFLMILIPGFPKDTLGIFLGLTPFPAKTFFWFTLIGRLPGTVLLTLQGALLYKESYRVFFIMLAVFVVTSFVLYWFRTHIYTAVEKLDRKNGVTSCEETDKIEKKNI